MKERKETLAEILTEENENLYEANKYALYTDYQTTREMMFKVCEFNRKLIETIDSLETRLSKFENNQTKTEEKPVFEILKLSTEKGNWIVLSVQSEGIEYKVEAKTFVEPDERYGIPQSDYRITKLFVKNVTNNETVVMSDRGYLSGGENLEKPLIKALIKEILKFADVGLVDNLE